MISENFADGNSEKLLITTFMKIFFILRMMSLLLVEVNCKNASTNLESSKNSRKIRKK